MRKPQPFTIGTRLSIPKCPDASTSSPGVDGASKPRNVSDRVSEYLAQVAPPSPPRGAPHSRSPVARLTDGDHFHPGSLVRSIKKITLSRQADGAARGEGLVAMSPRLLAKTAHGNCNNNNNRGLRHILPDAPDFPRDWSMRDPRMIIGAAECHKTAKCPGPPCDFTMSDVVRRAPSAGRASNQPPDISQLSRDIKQAESWVQCKLQDLSDGGATCSSTLIQRDIQTFENTVMKLSQMVDHVTRAQPPGSASVCPQLQSLRDQWQLLKQTAANQNCAVGGATTLQEFNKKADELEIWMREKEEIPPLHVILDENLEKVQITRKILDLRQEQIHYCNLQENINSLGQKLEKQGRPEGRAASTRRKHLNRMWLRLQTSLHEHHQSLQLALEAASLWHQADAILRAMEEKSCCAEERSGDDGLGDQDLRDIAGQVMMLDVTVSQVSNLHPLLSSRALHKHQQVKERWAQLQHTLRTKKTSRTAPSTIPSREAGGRPTPEQSSVGNQEQSLLGSGGPTSQTETTNSGRQTGLTPRQTRRPTDPKRLETNHNPQNGHQPHGPPETPEVRHLLRELSSTSQWLQDVELLLSEPAAMRSPQLIRKDLKQVSLLEREVRARGSALHSLRGKARRFQKPDWTENEEMEVKVQEVEERYQTVQDALRRRVSDLRDTLVLSEFMKVVQMEEERKKKETMTTQGAAQSDPDVPAADRTAAFTPLEELQEAVEMLNDAVKERERALAATRETAELESKVSALSQMMAAAHTKLQDVRSQLEAAEKEFVAVKKETELRDLQEIFRQQQQVETNMSEAIGLEVRRLQDQKEQMQGPAGSLSAGRSIEGTLRTWTDLKTLLQENQARLQRTERLREFFLRYLGMISWTEVTRGQILSESPRGRLSPAQREELERTMEMKLKEYEALAGIGWKLIGEDDLLAQMIRERLEEVQGLLSWLLMRWRCQKQQRIVGNHRTKMRTNEVADGVDGAKISPSSVALEEFECPEDEDSTSHPAPRGPILRRYRRRALSPILFQSPSCRPPSGTDMEERGHIPEDGPRKCARGPLWLEPKSLPTGSASPEPQEEAVTVTGKLDFHLMEGPLERKHVLQVGGRKASSRTWGTFYAVLVRRTLCFYHDHKPSTKSSASAPPLHLTGAVCTPESDYTKRDNCFRLRLLDGSEYLFRAPTPESLQQWVTKLRHNSGMEDSDLLRDAAPASDLSPRIRSRSLMPDLCQSVPARAADMVPVTAPSYWKKSVAAEISKPNSHHLPPGRFQMSGEEAAEPDSNMTWRRRSQSFSSVVYQKVTPVSGPQETSSSFSVTLYIDDPLIPRGRCHSIAAPQGELLSRYSADLRPRNKSVFKKFFRKKE